MNRIEPFKQAKQKTFMSLYCFLFFVFWLFFEMKKKRSDGGGEEGKSKKSKVGSSVVSSPISDVLFGRVRALVDEARGSGVAVTAQYALAMLCAAHPAYRRLPSALLLRNIAHSLRHIREHEPVPPPPPPPRTRQEHNDHHDDDDDEEEEGEGEEQEEDEGRTNLMNNTLRKAYAKTPPPANAAPPAAAPVVVVSGTDFEVPSARYSDVVILLPLSRSVC